MLKNFCFCPSQHCAGRASQTSFNYQTLATTAPTLDRITIDREEKMSASIRSRTRRLMAAAAGAENSCSSSCRSNSIEAYEESANAAFTFLSSSTTATTTTSAAVTSTAATVVAANNSIHFYHPKSIQSSSSSSSSSSSNSSTTSRRTDEDYTRRQEQVNVCKNLISNLTPLSESIRFQLQQRSNNSNNSNTSTNNKENLKSASRSAKKLITSTAVINLKPSPPVSQPPSLDENRPSNIMSSSSYNSKQTVVSVPQQKKHHQKQQDPEPTSLGEKNTRQRTSKEEGKTTNTNSQIAVDLNTSEIAGGNSTATNKNTADIYESISSSNNVLEATKKPTSDQTSTKATKSDVTNDEEQVANVPETYNNNISGQEIVYMHNEDNVQKQPTTNLTTKPVKANVKMHKRIVKKIYTVAPIDSMTDNREISECLSCECSTSTTPHHHRTQQTKKRLRINLKETKIVGESFIPAAQIDKTAINKSSCKNIQRVNARKAQSVPTDNEKEIQAQNQTDDGEKNNRANTIEAAASNNVNTTNSSNKTTTDETATRIMAEECLTKLISRLETVTNRLENYAHHGGPSSHPVVNGTAAKPTQNGTAEPLPASIAGFDDIINGSLASFKELSGKIGTEVKTIVDIVEKVFKLERSFLIEAARSVQPSQDALNKFFQQFAKSIEEVQAFKEKNRSSALFNHLSTISESIGALGWIAVSPAPAPYVKEMSDSGQFFSNRVLKEYKEKDQNHVNWVKQWLQLLNELQAYVKQTHTTGVAWNSTRQSKTFDASRVSTSDSSSSSAPAPPAAAPSGPPPPPPPPMPSFNDLFADGGNQQSEGGASTHEALFAEINKGSDITRTLKKVSDDQKTHKNPNLRVANTVPGAPSTTKTVKSGPGASATVKPPVLELQDKKWRVEYQRNNHNLVIGDTDLKQTIYIYNCSECTVTVKGKVNSITIDSCHRVGLLFDDVLAMVEFINSTSSQMQVIGKCPTVSIDKSDAIQVYLSRASIDAEIVTSKSSAMNVLVPNENGDEFSEYPVPEQYKTLFNVKSKKLVTTPTETA